MNAIYKVIYNQSTQTFQAVSELGKNHQSSAQTTKLGGLKKVLNKAKSLLALSVALILSHTAIAAPTGGQVVAGQAGISQTALTTNITQTSQNAAINWQQFNIAPQETVNFNQPNANAITLNRVLGNETSVLDGAMRANGKVFITNPNGVLIGKDAIINVGSLLATTAHISNDDFMAGRYHFDSALRDGAGKITQLGSIRVPKGGSVALVAPIVENYGNITAIEGNVLLASADKFRVTLDGETLGYTLDKGVLQGLVDNGGMIVADGGVVVLTSLGVDTVKKSLIKHSGVIQANTVSSRGGRIELLGDLDHSRLELSGTLQAKAKEGDGGFIETSAARLDIKDTAHVSTQSTNGKTGTWVIDPQDFTVAPTGGDMTGQQVGTALQSNNVTLKSIDGKTDGNGDVIINDTITWDKNTLTLNAQNDIHINKTMTGTGTAKLALEYGQASRDGTVTVIKDGQEEKQDNDYHLDKNTPIAQRTVKINLPAGQNFRTQKGMGGEVLDFEVIHQMPDIVKNSDDEWESYFDDINDRDRIINNIALGADIDVSHTKNYEGFIGWRLYSNGRDSTIHGLGHDVNNLYINSNKNEGRTIGLFQQSDLVRNINVKNVDVQTMGNGKMHNNSTSVGAILGVGHVYNSYATGNINTKGDYALTGGIVGGAGSVVNSYSIVNVRAIGDFAYVGGLIGHGYINKSHAAGNVSAAGNNTYAGGLAGQANIYHSHAAGNVSTTGNNTYAGGLVGKGGGFYNYATGNVSTTGENAHAGGIAGVGDGSYNYATGNITTKGKGSYAGGLIGKAGEYHWSQGNYATGNVSTTGENAHAGGIAGVGFVIVDSYATGNVSTTGENAHAGGIVGLGGVGMNSSYATNNTITATGQNSTTGGVIGYYTGERHKWIGAHTSFFNTSKHPTLSAIGNYDNGIDKSKITNVTGKTDAELKQKSTFKDWDFDKVWRISEGSDYPRLRALTEGVITIKPDTPATGKDLRIRGVNLTKKYNGEPIITLDELTSLEGWKKDGVLPIGLSPNDELSDPNIFTGKLTLGGTWQGAVDVGEYSIIPSGLQSQKYEIRYEAGKLSINPIVLSAIGTRPYNGLSRVVADQYTKLVGAILPKDQGKLTVTGSSTITTKQPDRFVDATDVGTYELVGGDLTVSNKNYIVNPALSRWTITPKVITLTGNTQSKKVTTANVNFSRLAIEPKDSGKVKLIGQGTLGNNNKLAQHSFTLIGEKAKNYTLDTSKTWQITNDTSPKPQQPPVSPNTAIDRQIQAIQDAISKAQQARQNAVKALIDAKTQNQPFDENYNQAIIRAKNQARLMIVQLSDDTPQKTTLLNRLNNITLIAGYTPSRPTPPSADTGTKPDNSNKPQINAEIDSNTSSEHKNPDKPKLPEKFIGQIEAERGAVFLREREKRTIKETETVLKPVKKQLVNTVEYKGSFQQSGFSLKNPTEEIFSDGSSKVTLNIFNAKSAALEIQVLDKNGELVHSNIAEPNYPNTSVAGDVKDKFTAFVELFFTDKQGSEFTGMSKESNIVVEVPPGGQVQFTYNSSKAKMYNFIEPVADLVASTIPVQSKIKNKIAKEIVEDAMREFVKQGIISASGEVINPTSDSYLMSVIYKSFEKTIDKYMSIEVMTKGTDYSTTLLDAGATLSPVSVQKVFAETLAKGLNGITPVINFNRDFSGLNSTFKSNHKFKKPKQR